MIGPTGRRVGRSVVAPTAFQAALALTGGKLRQPLAILAVMCLLCSTISAQGGSTVLNFDSLTDSTSVSNQYTGVVFANTMVLTAGISLNEFEFPPYSGTNVVADSGGPMTIAFATPATTVGGYFTYTVPLTIVAFDVLHQAVASSISRFSSNTAISGDPGSSPNEWIQVSSPLGISSITITGAASGSSFALDNLTISPEITGIGARAQAITFGMLSDVTLPASGITLTATASSGLAVSYISITPSVCTVSGTTLKPVAAGTCSITATQPGNSTYAAATPVTQTFKVLSPPPAIVSFSPNSGAGTSVTFKAVYSDPNGAGDLSELLLQVNASQSSANACYVYYQPKGNHLYLANDSGNAWTAPALTPGVAGTASNSQCTLNAGTSSITTMGDDLTLSVALTFSSTVTGSQNVYLYAANLSGQNSGWVKEGTWAPNPSAVPPSIVSLSPNSGAGASVTFKAVYSDPNGAGDLSELLLQVNTSESSANACYVYYQPQGNHLYLANNAGNVWIPPALTPGATGTASNSQCTLNAGSGSVTTAGNDLTLSVALSFSNTFVGEKNVYLYAAGISGRNSGWVREGAFTVLTPQTITFDAIPDQIFGVSPFPVAAQSSSLLPVGLKSATSAVCKVSDDLVMLLAAGTCSITASQPGNASYGTASPVTRSFLVKLAAHSGSFLGAAGSPCAVGGGPGSVVVGDFNRDGFPDLATADFSSNNVTVLLGNGLGGFTAAPGSPFTAGTYPVSVVVGDFNGDGIQDLAAANHLDDNVIVLLGNGSGGFTPAPSSPFAAGAEPQSLAAGDFNRDGIQDLAIANSVSNNVTVLLGNGSGGFMPASGSPFSVGDGPYSVVVGDFNGDGIQDLATANSGSGNVTVLLGKVSGGFTMAPGSPFAAGTKPLSLGVGDFDGDGFQDLAAANFGSNDMTVLLGNGSGGFTAATGSPFTVGFAPASVVVADFNGDGFQDLAAANWRSNDITVLLGSGSAGFMAMTGSPLAVGSYPSSVIVADFNGDGVEDLATANSGSDNVTVLLGLVVGSIPQTITFGPLSSVTYGVAPFTISATSTSGLTVSFASTTATVCTVAGTTVTVVGGGTCTIVASQAGNSTYAPAMTLTRTFFVSTFVSAGPPAIVSFLPNSGAGMSVTFKAIYSDPNGAADLNEILLQVNASQSSANACYVYYQPQGNHLYLSNNAGNAWMTPALAPGVAGTASNSQCTLNAGSSSVSTAGNDLTLNVELNFTGAFVGSRNVYLYAAGLSRQNSGWVKKGTWVP
jgi:hypothetical protein